jgi:hypothetical protein
LGIGDWGLGPIPNPQSPIVYVKENIKDFNLNDLKNNFIFVYNKKIFKFNFCEKKSEITNLYEINYH